MDQQVFIDRIIQEFPDAVIDIEGQDCSFELYIISDAFTGLNTLERQRPILALFNEELKTGKLHALSIKAKTLAEMRNNSSLIQIQN
jgi:acid stress-induced BolA-like protein IbaG/YrbA